MTLLASELIRRKRDGGALDVEQIRWLIAGIADGTLTDAQVGALAMAVAIRGLTDVEAVAWTQAMTDTGEVLRWDLDRPVLDKHSTGGVGDKVSLLLAPIVAACGGAVPMIAGRGLGHTGGTIDKLEAIPGYDVAPSADRLRAAVADVGCAIVGQTAELAPADRRLYAIRDATGTVESIPLIVASILSKKLAAGLDALVMDVKVGSGAFLPERERASALAGAILDVAHGNGLACEALLTGMDQVLGRSAGNALEVREAIDHLTGVAHDQRLVEVTARLAERMLHLGNLDADPAEALRSGAAAECFAAMVAALGGPSDLLERPDRHLARAPFARAAHPPTAGYVAAIETRAVGMVVVMLGGGRASETARIDPAVGLTDVAARGEAVGPGTDDRPLAVVHARTDSAAQAAADALASAFVVAERPSPADPVVLDLMT